MDKDHRLIKRQVKLEKSAQRFQSSRAAQTMSKPTVSTTNTSSNPAHYRGGVASAKGRHKDVRSQYEEPDVVLVGSVRFIPIQIRPFNHFLHFRTLKPTVQRGRRQREKANGFVFSLWLGCCCLAFSLFSRSFPRNQTFRNKFTAAFTFPIKEFVVFYGNSTPQSAPASSSIRNAPLSSLPCTIHSPY